MNVKNILSDLPESIPDELFEEIASSKTCKIERIISKGHSTPQDKWYDQEKNEFVIIIKGNAELLFKDDKTVQMKQGDYLNIPPHVKHRVQKTSTQEETVSLAIHYD